MNLCVGSLWHLSNFAVWWHNILTREIEEFQPQGGKKYIKQTFHTRVCVSVRPVEDADYQLSGLVWFPFQLWLQSDLHSLYCAWSRQVTTLCTLVCTFPRATSGGDATDASPATRRSGNDLNRAQMGPSPMGRAQMWTSSNLSVSPADTNVMCA